MITFTGPNSSLSKQSSQDWAVIGLLAALVILSAFTTTAKGAIALSLLLLVIVWTGAIKVLPIAGVPDRSSSSIGTY